MATSVTKDLPVRKKYFIYQMLQLFNQEVLQNTKLLRTQEIYREAYFNPRNIVYKSTKDV